MITRYMQRTIINIYKRAPKYIKQKPTGMKEEIDKSTIVADFNTLLSLMNN